MSLKDSKSNLLFNLPLIAFTGLVVAYGVVTYNISIQNKKFVQWENSHLSLSLAQIEARVDTIFDELNGNKNLWDAQKELSDTVCAKFDRGLDVFSSDLKNIETKLDISKPEMKMFLMEYLKRKEGFMLGSDNVSPGYYSTLAKIDLAFNPMLDSLKQKFELYSEEKHKVLDLIQASFNKIRGGMPQKEEYEKASYVIESKKGGYKKPQNIKPVKSKEYLLAMDSAHKRIWSSPDAMKLLEDIGGLSRESQKILSLIEAEQKSELSSIGKIRSVNLSKVDESASLAYDSAMQKVNPDVLIQYARHKFIEEKLLFNFNNVGCDFYEVQSEFFDGDYVAEYRSFDKYIKELQRFADARDLTTKSSQLREFILEMEEVRVLRKAEINEIEAQYCFEVDAVNKQFSDKKDLQTAEINAQLSRLYVVYNAFRSVE